MVFILIVDDFVSGATFGALLKAVGDTVFQYLLTRTILFKKTEKGNMIQLCGDSASLASGVSRILGYKPARESLDEEGKTFKYLIGHVPEVENDKKEKKDFESSYLRLVNRKKMFYNKYRSNHGLPKYHILCKASEDIDIKRGALDLIHDVFNVPEKNRRKGKLNPRLYGLIPLFRLLYL